MNLDKFGDKMSKDQVVDFIQDFSAEKLKIMFCLSIERYIKLEAKYLFMKLIVTILLISNLLYAYAAYRR